MRKTETARRKAMSTRNRHNGKLNAWKKYVWQKGETFATTDGVQYRALMGMVRIDSEGKPLPGQAIKSSIIRIPQVVGATS